MGVASTRDGLSSQGGVIEARRALVRRVVESSAFAKSERLSRFLCCICDFSLSGRASEINEQRIGTEVFGRAPGYDSSVDGIVRPQASRLRQRLDLYFKGEGVNEPVRITLPRGSYVPVFEPNPGQSPGVDPPSVPAVIPLVSSLPESTSRVPSILRSARLPWILVMVLLVALLVVGVRSAKRFTANTSTPSTLHPLWSLLFRLNQRTIVVPSDTGLV
ncbi:MAG TPA: hypothetical protein VGM27_32770, partial [Acidobacteriaceae bacterium]